MSHGYNTPPEVRSWAYPDCPECMSDVYVDCLNKEHGRFRCNFCGVHFRVRMWGEQ